jgi:alpha-galactosidase
VPPEYHGAHVSAPVNHYTGRQLSLDFRAATAFFGSLALSGI